MKLDKPDKMRRNEGSKKMKPSGGRGGDGMDKGGRPPDDPLDPRDRWKDNPDEPDGRLRLKDFLNMGTLFSEDDRARLRRILFGEDGLDRLRPNK